MWRSKGRNENNMQKNIKKKTEREGVKTLKMGTRGKTKTEWGIQNLVGTKKCLTYDHDLLRSSIYNSRTKN